jgi:ATP-dependent RNA helicase DDX24/MAK5
MEDKVKYKENVGLRTILCSATIEQLHQKKGGNTTEVSFEKLIKNIKFYNKLIYLKLKTADSLLPEINKSQNVPEDSSILPSKLELDSYKCDSLTKDYYLYYLLKNNPNSKIIVFTNSISHTKKLYSIFSYFNDFKCTILHSKLLQNNRIKNLEKFTKKQAPILFCTDIGARGLDIPLVDLVIHYHIPKKVETFVHRSGRTARANQNGKVSSLVNQNEFGLYKKILVDLKFKNFSMKTMSLSELEKIKSLFEFAKNIEKENFEIQKKIKEKQWFKKNADECDIDYSDEERLSDRDEEEKMKEKFLNKKRKLLNKENLKQKKAICQIE